MLVLSRAIDQEIVVGAAGTVLREPVVIRVVRLKNGGRVLLGVEAPIEVPVNRREVADRIDAEKGSNGDAVSV